MSEHTKIKTDDGKTFSYQIKRCFGVHFLLVMANFDTVKEVTFFETMEAPGIKQMDSIGTYSPVLGYVIYLLSKPYNETELLNSIENSLKSKFK